MIRLEPAPSVHQRYFDPRGKCHRRREVKAFVRVRLDGRHFKRTATPRRRSLWGALAGLFRGST